MAADNEPTPIHGHGGVIFDAAGNQQPSDGGKPPAETQEPEAPATSGPTITLRDEIYDFAAIISQLAKHPKQGGMGINPNVGIQIIATVLQNNIQVRQLGMMGSMPQAATPAAEEANDES